MPFPDSFSTARLEAERLTTGHLPELVRMHRDRAVMVHLGGLREPDQTLEYLDRNLQHWDDHGFGLWILRQSGGGDAVGRAVLRHVLIEGVDEVEVGYAFYEPYWGRGLATEVTAACLDHAREELGLDSIVAITSPGNHASQHVLQKAGLVLDREFLHLDAPALLFRRTLR